MSSGNTEQSPQFEFVLPPAGTEKASEQSLERPVYQETQKRAPQAQPTINQPVSDAIAPALPVADDTAVASGPLAPASPTAHLIAEDTDLIEKEWVERAKHIVASTKDDPFKQKNEISKAKADYVKKRFNKTIKVDDSARA